CALPICPPASQSFTAKAKGIWEFRQNLRIPGRIGVKAGGQNIANWTYDLKPDLPPVIRLTKRPGTTPNQVLKLTYEMQDDYGITKANARFRLKPSATQDDEIPPLVKPPDFPLSIPAHRSRAVKQTLYRDLTAHPWAGLVVELTLEARDEAGHIAKSSPVLMRLPERVFTKPLARAIIEQRRMLALDPENRWIAGTALDALSLAPEHFIRDFGVYLGIRAAYRALHQINDEVDLSEVIDLLWDIALDIEGGNLSMASRKLRQAQERLRKALENGASDEQIAKLMQQLKQALGQYLDAMRKRAAKSRPNSKQQRLPGNRVVRPQDLARMLNELEKMAKSGARDAAREMLSKLQDLLENLTAGPAPHERREDQAMNKWMEDLDGLMRDQQKLQEETFSNRKPGTDKKSGTNRALADQQDKAPDGRNGKEKAPAGAEKNARENKDAKRQQALQGRQKALRQALEALNRQLGKMGLKAPNPFGRAGEAMRRAERQLGKGRNGRAAGEQGKALDNLRRGMRAIARQIMRRMAKNAGGGPQGNRRTDPLGRPLPANQLGNAEKMRRGSKNAAEEAYRIRNELKRRLGERSRSRAERRYLERLLRWF
ncbi:MAG TPA: TIGR02302 family protein, partial [Rhizobiales bacterium]|nr:TIGR02302 family protein [Hyphomicrobiales bacterium]